MTGAWITDIRDFLDERGRVPHDLPAVPIYMGAIVEAASCLPPGRLVSLDLRCRRRPGHRRCDGVVHASVESGDARILWHCPCCGDHGCIYNWQGSPWDRRAGRPGPEVPSKAGSTGFSPRANAAWNTIPPEIRARLLNNFWCGACGGNASAWFDQHVKNAPARPTKAPDENPRPK